MGYSIEVDYPNGRHLPTNSDHSFLSIISSYSGRLRGLNLTKTVNQIFDGDAEAVFGVNKHIEHGDPLHITLSAKKWQ